MSWMNGWEIEEARERYREHPFLGPATATLVSLRDAVNECSDGWGYWQAPSRAAKQLMALIQGEGVTREELRAVGFYEDPRFLRFDLQRKDVTHAKLTLAYRPLKAFHTRQGLIFDIVEVDTQGAPLIFQ